MVAKKRTSAAASDPDKIRPTAAARLLGSSHTFIYNKVKAGDLEKFWAKRGKGKQLLVSRREVLKLKKTLDATKARVYGAARGNEDADGVREEQADAIPQAPDSVMTLLRSFKDALRSMGVTGEVTVSGLPCGVVVIRPSANELVIQ